MAALEPGARPKLTIRPCGDHELDAMHAIINAAAAAYRGVIPDDCWHEPYMTLPQLRSEIEAGVAFLGCQIGGTLCGVMGVQPVRNVELIRHAYVLPAHQGAGVGSALIRAVQARTSRQRLVGAWTAAAWASAFYEGHGFARVGAAKALLLRTYWTISDRQVETSVVLASPPLSDAEAGRLIRDAAATPPPLA